MKQWKETAAVLGRVARLADAGRDAAVATVVRIVGSSYRRPGAKLLVEPGGETSGGVSGGCLEADVREAARAVVRGARPRLLHYETASADENPFGLGLGCGGSVDVFVQPATTPEALESVRRALELLRGEKPFAVSTVLEGERAGRCVVFAGGAIEGSTGSPALDAALRGEGEERLRERRSALRRMEGVEVFTDVFDPPPRLAVFGAGDDAVPLVGYAADVGFRVTVVDHRPALLTAERFPGATSLALRRPEEGLGSLALGPRGFAVVKSHSLAADREWLAALVRCDLRYIGLLGPRERVERVLRESGAAGDPRIYGPVGLDLAADGAEQVAVSVVAELLAVRAGRDQRHLRAREGPIHAS